MKKALFFGLLVGVLCLWSSHKAYTQTTFYNTYGHTTDGGEGRNVAQASDGGYFLTYYTYTAGIFTTCLTKLNCAGVKEWDLHFNSGETTLPVELIPQQDNGCLLILSIKKNAEWKAAVLRLDASGNQQWTTSVPMHIAGAVGCAAQSIDESIYVCGSITAAATGTTGTALAKINPSGSLAWLKHYYDQAYHTPLAITCTSGNKIAITGTGSLSPQPFSDLFVMLCDKDGNFIQRKIFGTYYDDMPTSICADKNGSIYITGYSYFLGSEWDVLFLKLDEGLTIVQSKFYNAATPQGEQARYITSTTNNGIAIFGDEGGFNERNPMMMQLNSNGDLQWAKSYPVSPAFTNYCFQGAQCADGGFLLTGDVRPPTQYRFAPILKTQANGNMGCYTSTLNLTTRAETMTVSNASLLTFTTMDTANMQTIPVVLLPTSEMVYCSHTMPCGDYTAKGEGCPQICYEFSDHSVNASSWLWAFENGTPSSSVSRFPGPVCYSEAGMQKVTLELTNANGTTIYTHYINSEPDCPVIIPNIFSPNGDGVNDVFFAKYVKGNFSLQIFNRWGKLLYDAPYPGKWWNGNTDEGTKATDGLYFYVLKLQQNDKTMHGTVQLVR